MKTGIIYRAFIPSTGKSYIGQTFKTLDQRKRKHYSSSLSKDTKFGRALKKYRGEFQWEVIEKVSHYDLDELVLLLNEKEIHYISAFDSIKKGYNTAEGGWNFRRKNLTEKERFEISKKQTVLLDINKLITLYEQDNPRLTTYQIAAELGVSVNVITKRLRPLKKLGIVIGRRQPKKPQKVKMSRQEISEFLKELKTIKLDIQYLIHLYQDTDTTIHKIAELLGVSHVTVKSRLRVLRGEGKVGMRKKA